MAPLGSWLCLIGSIFTQQAAALVSANANAVAARQQSLEAAWSRDLSEAKKGNAVKRVINLLNKMKAQLEAEADKESEMYDKMVCWCETNEKEKKQAVADAEAKDKQLVAEIESRSARGGELATNIAASKKEIAANKEALAQATAIREAEAAKFREENKDLVQAITNLRNAVAVLAKHQGSSSMLQLSGPMLTGMRVVLRDVALKYEEMMAGRAERRRLDEPQAVSLLEQVTTARRTINDDRISQVLFSALDVNDDSVAGLLPTKLAVRVVEREAGNGKFLQVSGQQPLYKSYATRSNQIFGILKQMQEEFEAELSSEQKAETRAQEEFKAMAAAKTAEIDAGEKSLDEMEVEASGNQKALSDANEDLTLTREQRSADVEFLKNLQTTCNDLDTQWEKRSTTRAAETKAVAEAIAILTQDDNKEMLYKSVSLLQEQSTAEASARRGSAVSVLRRAASAPGFDADDLLEAWHGRGVGAAAGPRAQLSTLAVAVQLDSFTKVKAMMDKMLVDLQEEQEEEVAFKTQCNQELNDNEKMTYDKNEQKRDLEATIDRLEKLIKQLAAEIAAAKQQIADASLEIKKASQQREAENAEFQQVVADQRATQDILNKALTKLKDFYVKKIGQVVFAQRAAQEPPVKFNSYKTNAGGSPVINLIEQIIGDSQQLESEATTSERDAQAAYEKFVLDSNSMIKGLQAAITAKTKATAAANSDMAEANGDLDSTVSELESLAEYKADLHHQCDFVLKNFDIRQAARNQEMEAIRAAKAILSGMK